MRTRKMSLTAGVTALITAAGALWGVGPASAATDAPLNTRLEAESYANQWGTRVAAAERSSGGYIVTQFSSGDFLRYDNVTTRGAAHTLLCFSAAATTQSGTEVGTVEIRFDSLWSKPALSVPLRSWLPGVGSQWASGGPVPDGTRRVYLTIRQPRSSEPVNLDYLFFASTPPPPSLNC